MTEIYDSNRQLKYANDDLRAIRLKVIDKALEAIIEDIQRAVNNIDTTLDKLKTETESV